MFTARVLGTGQDVKFKSVDALARRLGGKTAGYRPEYDPTYATPARTLMVTRTDRHGTHVVERVRVPREAL